MLVNSKAADAYQPDISAGFFEAIDTFERSTCSSAVGFFLRQGQSHGIQPYFCPLICLMACLLLSLRAVHGPARANRPKHSRFSCGGFVKCAVAVDYIFHVK